MPMYISKLLTTVADIPSQSTLHYASKGIFVMPRTRLKLGETVFSVTAPQAWNRLPAEISTIPAFKHVLKHFSSGLLTTTNISYIFIYVIIFKTLPFLFVFMVLDIVMRCRSICWRRTKSNVLIVIVMQNQLTLSYAKRHYEIKQAFVRLCMLFATCYKNWCIWRQNAGRMVNLHIFYWQHWSSIFYFMWFLELCHLTFRCIRRKEIC